MLSFLLCPQFGSAPAFHSPSPCVTVMANENDKVSICSAGQCNGTTHKTTNLSINSVVSMPDQQGCDNHTTRHGDR